MLIVDTAELAHDTITRLIQMGFMRHHQAPTATPPLADWLKERLQAREAPVLEMVDRLRAAVEAINGGQFHEDLAALLEAAADHIEDLAARVDDLEAMICPVCGEAAASCGHDPSTPGPPVVGEDE